DRLRHAGPGKRERDHRPEDRCGAGWQRLQGAPDRHRPAPGGQHPGLDRRVRAPPERARGVSTEAVTSLAAHFAAHAERAPDAPALIWDGQATSYGELQSMAESALTEHDLASLPADRPIGIRAKKSPEAIALILAW